MISFQFALFMIIHIFACLWMVISAAFFSNSWLDKEDKAKMNSVELYLTSIYFITTTITTVGYGDMA